MALIDDLWRDLDRLERMGATRGEMCRDPGAWVITAYRVGRAIAVLPAIARRPLFALRKPVHQLIEAFAGVTLPLDAEIGGGLYLGHTGGITISKEARLGRDCNLSHGVVIESGRGGAPWIGDRVYLGPGVKVLGPVRIGDDAAIGRNQVIDRDVPDGASVGAVPGRLLSLDGARPSRVLVGRRMPLLGDRLRKLLRAALPRPTQLLVRA